MTTTEAWQEGRVMQAMLRQPTVHDHAVSVAELRRLFLDDHVHMALLLEGDRLVTTVERGDIPPSAVDEAPACLYGTLGGRTAAPETSLRDAVGLMRRGARRRLAVLDEATGWLLGLLCLKASGLGFCSDEGVQSRRAERAAREALRNGAA